MQQPKTKEEKKAMQEWIYIQSCVKNDTVLLGMILGVEMFAYLDRREEDGALVPSMKIRQLKTKATAEEIENTKKIHDQRKLDLLKLLGDTNPEIKVSFEIKPEEIPAEEKALFDYFWNKYLGIEAHYEAGFIPLLVGEQAAIYATYDIVPKKKKEQVVHKDVNKESATI